VLMRKVESLMKAQEVESKKLKREALIRDKNSTIINPTRRDFFKSNKRCYKISTGMAESAPGYEQGYVADVGKSWPVLIVFGGFLPLFLSFLWLLMVRHFVAMGYYNFLQRSHNICHNVILHERFGIAGMEHYWREGTEQ
ncbi:hypothetical protein Tco_1462138, partial [Tanacetum coccineum]